MARYLFVGISVFYTSWCGARVRRSPKQVFTFYRKKVQRLFRFFILLFERDGYSEMDNVVASGVAPCCAEFTLCHKFTELTSFASHVRPRVLAYLL